MQVIVRDNNVSQALRTLKKKMQREGLFREFKKRAFYEKPTQKRKRKKAESEARLRKSETRKKAADFGMSLKDYKARKNGRSPR